MHLYIYIYIYIYIHREGAVERINERQLHNCSTQHTPVSSPTEGASDISEGALTLMHIYLTYRILSSPLS